MEQNQFDLLEEVEKVEADIPATPALKEYEKLLLAERDRKEYEKAVSLVDAGCFEQKQIPVIDFNEYEKIISDKKYKKVYDLYRNKETFELVFICPLIENNKGDADEKKDMTPYSYDCLFVESMDAETYALVMKAAKNNIKNSVSVLYKTSWIAYWIFLAITLINFGYNFYSNLASGTALDASFFGSLFYTASFFVGALIMLPLLCLLAIKYKKYKDQ